MWNLNRLPVMKPMVEFVENCPNETNCKLQYIECNKKQKYNADDLYHLQSLTDIIRTIKD